MQTGALDGGRVLTASEVLKQASRSSFFFLVAKGLSTVTRIAIRMKVEVRGKSIQPAYVIVRNPQSWFRTYDINLWNQLGSK